MSGQRFILVYWQIAVDAIFFYINIAMKIKQSVIDQIKEQSSIYDVISSRIAVKKAGRNYSACCPFHEDSSPSMSINQGKNFYHCFGCGASGDSIKFVREYEKKSFVEAIEILAKELGIPCEYENNQDSGKYKEKLALEESLKQIYLDAEKFYCDRLTQYDKARRYLLDRKISNTTIEHFHIGYAPGSWNDRQYLLRYLTQKKYPVELILQSGLIKVDQKLNQYVDFFFDRITIPINNKFGQPIAFGGRAMGDAMPKYLNSEESPIFSKRNNLFALDKAFKSISKEDKAILVEGYFDAIALHQSGITNAVASLGTAISPEQIKMLCRYTQSNEIFLGMDNDSAGKKAVMAVTKSGVDMTKGILQQHKQEIFNGTIQFKIISLPDPYKDADEFLKQNKSEAYKEIMKFSPDAISWGIEQICKLYKGNEQKTINSLVIFLSPIQSPTLLEKYLIDAAYQLSLVTKIKQSILHDSLRRDIKKNQFSPKKKNVSVVPTQNKKTKQQIAERFILLFYIYRDEEIKNFILDKVEEMNFLFDDLIFNRIWFRIMDIERDSKPGNLKDSLSQVLSDEDMKSIELTENEKLDLSTSREQSIKFLESCFTVTTVNQKQQYIALLQESLSEGSKDPCKILSEIQNLSKQIHLKAS